MHDYTSFNEGPREDLLSKLSALADEQLQKEKELEAAEKHVKELKKELVDIAEHKIPELMDEAGVAEFKTSSGIKITIKENIRASISKANAIDAFKWLREHGHEALIKRKIVVEFSKGEDEDAARALELLQNEELAVDDNSTVHPQTLAKFVREKLEAGEDVPQELLGVYRQRVSTISV